MLRDAWSRCLKEVTQKRNIRPHSFHPVRKTSVSIKWRPTAIKKYVHSMYQKLELCTNHGASASRIHTKDKRKRNKAAAEVTDWPRMAVKRRLKSKCAKRKARVAKGKKR